MAIDTYRPTFDVARIDADGVRIPLAFESVKIYNVTQAVLIETVAADVYGVIAAGGYDSGPANAAPGDVIELQHATYPETARMTLEASPLLAITQNDVHAYIVENLATTSAARADIWATDDDEPDKEPFLLLPNALVGETSLIPYSSPIDKNLTLRLSPYNKDSEKHFRDVTQFDSNPITIPASGGGGSSSGGGLSIYDEFGTVYTIGTTPEVLLTNEWPADLFVNDGDTVFVEYHGKTGANANTKTIILDVDSNSAVNAVTTQNGKGWEVNASFMRSGSDSLMFGSEMTVTGDPPSIIVDELTGLNFAAPIPVLLEADGVAIADVSVWKAKAWFIPAATVTGIDGGDSSSAFGSIIDGGDFNDEWADIIDGGGS